LNFGIYQTSKIVEKSQSRRLLGSWFLTYLCYTFIWIIWLIYFIIILSFYLRGEPKTVSYSVTNFIKSPEFYEKEVSPNGLELNRNYPFDQHSAPISQTNPFAKNTLKSGNQTHLCFKVFSLNSPSESCFNLSLTYTNHFSVSYVVRAIEIQEPGFQLDYMMNYTLNEKYNREKFVVVNTSISHKIMNFKQETYSVFTYDKSTLEAVRNNRDVIPIFLVLLSTVSVFSLVRVFAFYVRDRILDVIYYVTTKGNVEELIKRNETLHEMIEDQNESKRNLKNKSMPSINQNDENVTSVAVRSTSVPTIVKNTQ
jgi:hypothetical protein